MKNFLLFSVLSLFTSVLWGQNLVLNPSFENTSACPIGVGEFANALSWYDINSGADSCSSPDLHAACAPAIGGVSTPNSILFGYQPSRTGSNHAGAIFFEDFAIGCNPLGLPGDYREYLGGELSAPLVAGQTYCVSFYINLANNSSWGISNLGFYFSNSLISHNFCTNGDLLPVTPQLVYSGPALTDTLNWVEVQWNYTATGGEQYFAIGNFDDNASTTLTNVACSAGGAFVLPDAYYLIDDVSVVPTACCNTQLSAVETNLSCGATNDGAIDLTASNGTAPYTYSWSNGATTEDLTGLTAGTYDVTVTDATGCTTTYSSTITASSGVTVTGTVTDVNCGGTNNGAIDITVNGAAPYTYSWSNGATTEDLTALAAGTYDVTVTDASSCTATYSGTVNATAGLSLTTTAVDPSCNGAADGCAIVSSSGTGPFTYLWSNGATTDTVCGLGAGTYDVTVTESGSSAGTDTLYLEDFEGTHNWTLNVSTGTNGADNNFWVVNDNEGGVLPPGCEITSNGDNSLHITSVFNSAGGAAYDAGGLCGLLFCPETNMRTESPVFSTVGYTGITLDFDFISVGDALNDNASVLYNDGTGWQLLDPSIKSGVCGGGQGQWTGFSAVLPASCDNNPTVQVAINWTNNDDGLGSDPSIAVNNILVTSTSTGGSSCSATASVTLNDPPLLTASVISSPENCGQSDGAVDLTVSGGSSPYTYSWSNGATTEDLSGLLAGFYDVTVTDANGCTTTASATVNAIGTLAFSLFVTDDSCGSSTGAIDLTPMMGTAPFTYSWSNGATTQDLSALQAGTYFVTIVDNDGCVIIESAVVNSVGGATVTLNSVTDVDCNGAATGVIDIDATAANLTCSSSSVVINEIMANPSDANDGVDPNTSEYIELIGPPGTNIGCYVLTDGDWTITIPAGTTIPADGIFTIGNDIIYGAGTFDLDAENCSCFTDGGGGSGLLIFTNGGEYLAMYDPTGTMIDGFIYGSPSAGNTPPSGGNTTGGVINTVGLSGCLSSVTIPGAASFTNLGLSAGNGDAFVRNPDGATGTWTTQTGGSVNACNFSTPPTLTYNWSTGDTTQDISGLVAGVYTVTVTDGSGCATIESYTITEPPAITVTTNSIVDASCITPGSIDISAAGGTGAYTYLWDDANTQTTAVATGLTAGTYNVTVTDANGCEMPAGPFSVNGSGVPIITIDAISNAICAGESSGAADISLSGGTAPYSYQWSSGQTTEDVTGLASGTYNVTATDDNGCTVSSAVTITEPSPISLAVLIGNATCVGDDGSIDLTVSGGVGPYTYLWDNGQATEDLNNLANADYELTVTDANACSTTYGSPITVALDTTIALTTTTTNLDCSGDPTGSVSLTVNNAAPAYSYIWSTGDTSASVTGLAAGSYDVTVTDASNCTISTSATVNTPIVPTVSAYIGQVGVVNDSIELGDEVTLNAGNDQTADGVTYDWTANPTDVSFTAVGSPITNATAESSGDYSFTVIATSPDACADTSTVTIYVNEQLDPAVPSAFTPNGDDVNETFYVINLPVDYLVEFKIFNRWGEVIYDDASVGVWDGSFNGADQPSDAYIYLISYQRPQDTEPVVLRGQLTLLR